MLAHLCLIYSCFWFVVAQDVYVTIPNGMLRGSVLLDRFGAQFEAYQSIPYAQTPIGHLRFQKPVKAQPWNGTWDATKEVTACTQVEPPLVISGQEDCLYVNVYTHRSPNLVPVFLFIHGGGFIRDSSSPSLIGPNYLMTKDIVFVTFNYRLGAFGNVVPNAGIYDQVMAMKWVKENIEYFGGDPNAITLGGESVGGMSAHLHLLSPLSQGLFHRVISMSGTSIHSLLYINRNYSRQLALKLGITSNDIQEIVHQMKHLSILEIANASQSLNIYPQTTLNAPLNAGFYVEDNDCNNNILNEYPVKVLQSGNFTSVPMLIGFTNDETGWLDTFPNRSLLMDLNSHIPFYVENRGKVVKLVRKYYNIEGNDSGDDEISLHKFWNDIWFRYHAQRAAKYHNNNVYFYVFSAHTSMHYISDYDTLNYQGAAHTDDLVYLFSNNNVKRIEPHSIEDIMIQKMVNVWTSFICNGTPIANDDQEWPLFDKNMQYVNITNSGFIYDTLDTEPFRFWDFIFKKFTNQNY